MKKGYSVFALVVVLSLLCGVGTVLAADCSFGTNDPNACMCGVRPTDSSKACQDDTYFCSPTAYSCMFRIPEGQQCPVAFATKHYETFSALPCQDGLVCCPSAGTATDMGGICRSSCGAPAQCAAPPSITTGSPLPGGTIGQAYSQQLQASGGQGTVTFSLAAGSSFPSNVTLATTGLISGTPSTGGTFNFIVVVTDSCSSGSQRSQKSFSWVIASSPTTSGGGGATQPPVSSGRLAGSNVCYAIDRSTTKKAEVPDRETAGGVDTLIADKTSQYEDCGTRDVRQLSNSLICYGGAPVPDCQNTVEKMYSSNPSCPAPSVSRAGGCYMPCPTGFTFDDASRTCKASGSPALYHATRLGKPSCPAGQELHDGVCYLPCPGIAISGKTVGSSWDGGGKCKGCLGPVCNTVNAAKTVNPSCPPLSETFNYDCFAACPAGFSFREGDCRANDVAAIKVDQVCPPPPPQWGSNSLPAPPTPGYTVRDGKCYARYCTLTKAPSKVLSCARPPESSNSQYPGKIEVSGSKAVCKVAEGIMTADYTRFSSGVAGSANPCVWPTQSLYCRPDNNLTYTKSGSCCRGEEDFVYKSGANECWAKFGRTQDGYYKPYTGTAQDVLAQFNIHISE
jgi:hypothetical protein